MIDLGKSIVEKIENEELSARGIQLFVKRDDLIHPDVSGNKWRKLKYNIELCKDRKNSGIVTFGGAFSNHLIATAAACSAFNIECVGVVRGDELNPESNATLSRCSDLGMQLKFISRDEYGMKNEKTYLDALSYEFPNHLIVPEGGANYYGIIGCQDILQEIDESIDFIFVAQGTTTTSCGILLEMNGDQKLFVVPALKGYNSIDEMTSLLSKAGFESSFINEKMKNVHVLSEFHFGGYGKYTSELIEFIKNFYHTTEIKLDPIYTGKAMFALFKTMQQEKFKDKNVLFVHTGGVQGAQGIIDKMGEEIYSTSK